VLLRGTTLIAERKIPFSRSAASNNAPSMITGRLRSGLLARGVQPTAPGWL